MSLYKRGDVWWYKFRFAGQMIRESSKSESKTVAKEAERSRHRELEESFNRISRPKTAQLFSTAAESWLQTKIAHLSPRSVIIERANLKHINPYFGKMLLCDVAADDIARYQAERLEKRAAPKTVNLEVGTLRAILRKNRLWASMGWSPSTTVRMSRRYGHIGQSSQRQAVNALSEAGFQGDGAQNWAQFFEVHPFSETDFLGTLAVS
jgi:integrase-like protein